MMRVHVLRDPVPAVTRQDRDAAAAAAGADVPAGRVLLGRPLDGGLPFRP